MTAVRWVVEHAAIGPLGPATTWIEYPDEATARQHAGTTATVWALVTPEVVDVLTAAADWWHIEEFPVHLMDDRERALVRAVNAYEHARQETP